MIHLADERDRGAKHDGADRNRGVGEIRPALSGEPCAEPMRAADAHEQHRETGNARDARPIRSNKREEGGRDQQAARNPHHGGDADFARDWPERSTNCIPGVSRNRSVGLPAQEVIIETAAIMPIEHGSILSESPRFVDAGGPVLAIS